MADGLTLRRAGPTLAIWVKLPAPEVVEIIALAGFDAVIIDLEHTLLDLQTVSTMIGLARLAGLSTLVRVPDHGAALIGRVLDAGANGVVIPQVHTVEQARNLAATAKFPPAGSRGLSNSARGGRWGATAPEVYMAAGDRDGVVIAQLESEAAVRDGLAIAAVDGIDYVLVGPADLAASMGCGPTDPRYSELLTTLENDRRTAGVTLAVATAGNPDAVRRYADRGYRLIVAGSDATLLHSAADNLVGTIRAADISEGNPA